ncbi:MAG: hypothetical protein H0U89_02535, partial [Acidimicrobiia bacterium]|nr:hypothetical protein [Acidimicrobiia bacterium]
SAMREVAPSDGDDGGATCVVALVEELDRLGFDPAVASDDEGTTIAFTHCPYARMAEAHPEIICSLHRGIVEGVVGAVGGAEVRHFGTLVDRRPCSVDLVPVTLVS